jgi:enoyl-CoA hydratase/carnithine racemase
MKPSIAISMGKRLFYQQIEKYQLAEAYHLADMTMSRNIVEPEAKEGMQAFVQKRKPSWTL